MRSFWGFYDNGIYRVGCNGGTVYVYDQDNKELAKFKDLKYAYEGAIRPGANIFVLKSGEGPLAVYDLNRKKWERTGCTEKKLQWSRLKSYEEKPQVTLKQVYDRR